MKITTKQITTIAILSAMYVVLAVLSIGTNDFKASFESVTLLIGASTLGPVGGFFIGIVGEFIHQLIGPYGIDATTVLWLMPYAFEGLAAGLYYNKAKKSESDLSNKTIYKGIVIGELVLIVLVTLVNWASAVIQGWGSWPLIAAAIPMRLVITVVRVGIYFALMPILYKNLKKVI